MMIVMARRRDLKLIVTSATMNADRVRQDIVMHEQEHLYLSCSFPNSLAMHLAFIYPVELSLSMSCLAKLHVRIMWIVQ